MLRVLDLYYKVAIFELEMRKCTSRTRLVLQSCDFRVGAAEVSVLCIPEPSKSTEISVHAEKSVNVHF